jgi:hypothetical protein
MYGGWDYTYSQQLWFLQWSQPTIPATIATLLAQGQENQATLQWHLPSQPRTAATIQRSTDGVHWSRVGARLPGGLSLPFTDHAVAPGVQYAYRALVNAPGSSMVSSPVWVTVPTAVGDPVAGVAFGLSANGGASRAAGVSVRCALPMRAAARVVLLDVAGRIRDSRDLSDLSAGVHSVVLGRDLEYGMYFVQLTQGARKASLKSVVLR